MMTIARTYSMQPEGHKGLGKAIAEASASMPPCKDYIRSIGEFVGSFAGGETFKFLQYLSFIGASAAFIQTYPKPV